MARTKLSVVVIIVCVVKCLAMSYDELEDFAEHLKKTSQLSPTLKKGLDSDVDYDDDEAVSDHAWEESGKFEGDLILNERQRRLIVEDVAVGLARNGIQDGTKRWPNNEVIVYIQVEHFTSDQVEAIGNGIQDIARASCIKFRPYRKGDRDAVVIQGNRRGCFSQVGYQGGYQVLNLSGRHPVGRGCFRHGTVVHEMLHTLGFYHMQSSSDRDDYVDIKWENIIQPARHNFRKYNSFSVSDFGVGYDYDSVLHYSRRAFSANGQDTIVPKQSGAEIGQRLGLSDKDTQKLNRMYCDAESDHGQADEDTSKKTASKKKNGKNKPYDGHGIGYHQGKAVVFKILPGAETHKLPAAETYKLPDVPSFHVFDYFSKEPQILSTSENEGFRIGKEIAYSYSPPEPKTTLESYALHGFNIKSQLQPDHEEIKLQDNNNNVTVQQQANIQNEKSETVIEKPTYDDHTKPPPLAEEDDGDLTEAFDRLSKIIKVHVYPSQTPDLSIYKTNGRYYDSPLLKPSTIINKPEGDKVASVIKHINHFYDISAEHFADEKKNDRQPDIHDETNKDNNDESLKQVTLSPQSDKDSSPWYKPYEDDYYHKPNLELTKEYSSIYSPKIYKDDMPKDDQNKFYQKYVRYYPHHEYHDYS